MKFQTPNDPQCLESDPLRPETRAQAPRAICCGLTILALFYTPCLQAEDDPFETSKLDTPSWQIVETTDEMTDTKSYLIGTSGTKVEDGYLAYRPDLIVRIQPLKKPKSGKMKYTSDVMISFSDWDGIRRDGCELVQRYDKRKPLTETWLASTDRRAAFAPDSAKMIRRLNVTTNLTVRWETTLGKIRTSTFNVQGFKETLDEVTRRFAKK